MVLKINFKTIFNFFYIINLCRIRVRIPEKENFRPRRGKEISENYFILISNDIFHKELKPIYSTQYGYYL